MIYRASPRAILINNRPELQDRLNKIAGLLKGLLLPAPGCCNHSPLARRQNTIALHQADEGE